MPPKKMKKEDEVKQEDEQNEVTKSADEKDLTLIKVPMRGEIIPKLKSVGFEVVHIHGSGSQFDPKSFYLEGEKSKIKAVLNADELKLVTDAEYSEIEEHNMTAAKRCDEEEKASGFRKKKYQK